MKFCSYLNEVRRPSWIKWTDVDVAQVIERIKKLCNPYLKKLKTEGIDIPFYRGINDSKWYNILWGERRVRKNRQAVGMSQSEADSFNIWLTLNGFCRRDESVMTTSNPDHASMFGNVFYFFPIGNFRYTILKDDDLNHKLQYDRDLRLYRNEVTPFLQAWNWITGNSINKPEDNVLKEFKTLFIQNKQLELAHKKGYEVWFECGSYICLNPREDVKELLK
jgi:hypothetical protein